MHSCAEQPRVEAMDELPRLSRGRSWPRRRSACGVGVPVVREAARYHTGARDALCSPRGVRGGRDLDSAGVSHADLHGSRRPQLPLEGLGKARVQCRLMREEGAVSSRMRYSVSPASLKCG